jgi:FkbM family methyltransferase
MSQIGLLARQVFKHLGLRVFRYSRTLEFKRQQLFRECGITLVFDVGANVGQYAREIRRDGYQGTIVSLEPASDAFLPLQHLAANGSRHIAQRTALGDANGAGVLYVTANSTSSSLLSFSASKYNDYAAFSIQRTEPVPVRRLENVIEEYAQPADRIFVKLDTQGYEKQILEGAGACLNKVAAMEIELSFQELYSGQALLPAVMELLMRYGFRCVWAERVCIDPRTNDMLQVDALFRGRNARIGDAC